MAPTQALVVAFRRSSRSGTKKPITRTNYDGDRGNRAEVTRQVDERATSEPRQHCADDRHHGLVGIELRDRLVLEPQRATLPSERGMGTAR